MKYYFILGSENFLFKEEPLEEVLRERVQNYNKKKKPLNFWIVPKPEFLKNPEFSDIQNKISKNCVAIISTEKTFITWLKLRLNNVAIGNFDLIPENKISPLKFAK
jgi:hypothetical protein|uniref:Ycf54 n=1 Tax=Gonyostomum semen TaxID=375454 RepID=UPI002115AEFC|nr:Ycf54 [Gonyostomum semen]UTE94402.1 Ycf54 [Gonyostomum semen]